MFYFQYLIWYANRRAILESLLMHVRGTFIPVFAGGENQERKHKQR